MNSIFCRYCGSKNNSDALYCRGCSAPFHDEYNQPEPVRQLDYNPYVTGSVLSLYGMGSYLPSGVAIAYPHLESGYVRASIITADEYREFLEIPQYQTTEPTKIEDLPDIKLLDKIKNKMMDWRNR